MEWPIYPALRQEVKVVVKGALAQLGRLTDRNNIRPSKRLRLALRGFSTDHVADRIKNQKKVARTSYLA